MGSLLPSPSHPSEACETVRMESLQTLLSPTHLPSPLCRRRRGLVMVLGEGVQTCDRGHLCGDRPYALPPDTPPPTPLPAQLLPLWHFEVPILPIPAEVVLPAFSSYCSLFLLSLFLGINSVISGLMVSSAL